MDNTPTNVKKPPGREARGVTLCLLKDIRSVQDVRSDAGRPFWRVSRKQTSPGVPPITDLQPGGSPPKLAVQMVPGVLLIPRAPQARGALDVGREQTVVGIFGGVRKRSIRTQCGRCLKDCFDA